MTLAEQEIKKFENHNCAENAVFYQAMEEVIYSIAPLLESDKKYTEHASSSIMHSDHIKAACVFIPRLLRVFLNFWVLSRF